MSYSNLTYFVLAPFLIFVSCNTTSSNNEKADPFELVITEVDSVGANSIRIKTNFELNKDYYKEESEVSYELYISTEDEPNELNTVSFTDLTDKDGLVEYDSQENEGTIINIIQGLELETDYNYRIKIKFGELKEWSEVSSFRTKDVVEIISSEVRNLKPRSVSLNTVFTINETWKYNSYVNYDIFISTDEIPNESNSVEFFDSTDMQGLVYYDEEKEEGFMHNPITGLLPSTEYYYRIKIVFENHEQLSDVVTFTTKDEITEGSGGIVFYEDRYGYYDWDYLVAAPHGWSGEEEDPSAQWGCFNTYVGSRESEVGTGLENTNRIVENECSSKDNVISAAEIAYELEINGFDDWYLPNTDELHKIFRSRHIYIPGSYWTSTEVDSTRAVSIDHSQSIIYDHGMDDYTIKGAEMKLRPIRKHNGDLDW